MTAPRLRLQPLEPRLTPAELFVDNPGDFVITTDTAPAGTLNNGDTVTWDPGADSGHGGARAGLVFGTNAFSTINSAAAAANDGDLIRVGPGGFFEVVIVDQGVFIAGNQVGRDPVTRTGNETVVRAIGTAFHVSASGAQITGFTVEGVGGSSGAITTSVPVAGLRIDHNIITGHRTGIRLNTAAGGERSFVTDNLFRDNDSAAAAVALRSDQQLENVTIARNVVTGNHPAGAIDIAGPETGRGVVIEQNTLTGPGAGDGVHFGELVPATAQVAVRNNFINNWGRAVRVESSRPGITVRGNHLGGSQAGTLSAGGLVEMDAGFNFYGRPEEPAVAVTIEGLWDFRPFLTDGTDAEPNTPGFQPVLKGTLVNATTATYLDPDEDLVTVKVSKGTLGDGNFRFVLPDRGDGLVLDELVLDNDPTQFVGADVTITARRTAAGGDGLASGVQAIDASGVDLGAVTVRGALGRLTAGDGNTIPARPAARRVDILTTADRFGSPGFVFTGGLGSFRCRGDFAGILVAIGGPTGSVVIGGSLLPQIPSGARGVVLFEDDVGSVAVRGDVLGKIDVLGDVGRLTVGGSLLGQDAEDTGFVRVLGATGPILIGGNLVGGPARNTGTLEVRGRAAALTVRGSVLGGPGSGPAIDAGSIEVGSAGRVVIGGDLVGGGNRRNGRFIADGDVGGLAVGGSVLGGADGDGTATGGVTIAGRAGPITIARDLRGDLGAAPGGGSLRAPVTLSVQGRQGPATQADALALASLTVGGSVTNARILVGHVGDTGVSPDVAAGPILVRGGWTASTLAVGIGTGPDQRFGTADDTPIVPKPGFPDAPGVVARVASLTVLGPAVGTATDFDGHLGDDHFGLVAQSFGRVSLGGVTLPLTGGLDAFGIGPTGDFRLREV